MKILTIILLVLVSTLSYGSGTGKLTVISHWVGPYSYDRIKVNTDVGAIGNHCSKTN